MVTIAAVVSVLRALHSHASVTQPLELAAGSQPSALQKAVKARVSVSYQMVKMFLFMLLKVYYNEPKTKHL